MALETVTVGEWLVQFYRIMHSDHGIVRHYVTHAIEFRIDRTHEVIVDVTGVTLVMKGEAVNEPSYLNPTVHQSFA